MANIRFFDKNEIDQDATFTFTTSSTNSSNLLFDNKIKNQLQSIN